MNCTTACHWGGTLKGVSFVTSADFYLQNTPDSISELAALPMLKWVCYVRKCAGQGILPAGPRLGTCALDLKSRSFEDRLP